MMKFKESTMALFFNTVTEAPHNCHHVTCGYYDTNLCRKWNAVPNVADTCGFPVMVYMVLLSKDRPGILPTYESKQSGSRLELG